MAAVAVVAVAAVADRRQSGRRFDLPPVALLELGCPEGAGLCPTENL